jgi:hypothetical protein
MVVYLPTVSTRGQFRVLTSETNVLLLCPQARGPEQCDSGECVLRRGLASGFPRFKILFRQMILVPFVEAQDDNLQYPVPSLGITAATVHSPVVFHKRSQCVLLCACVLCASGAHSWLEIGRYHQIRGEYESAVIIQVLFVQTVTEVSLYALARTVEQTHNHGPMCLPDLPGDPARREA